MRTTITLDEQVLTAVRARATPTGSSTSRVINDALRRDLGLGLLDHLWATNDLGETTALALAVHAQHATRPARRQ